MEKSIIKLGELFCGPGGIAYGAMKAKSSDGSLRIEHTWANDYDKDACKTYVTFRKYSDGVYLLDF